MTARARTCAAVTLWSGHRTSPYLYELMADSFRVPWKYLAGDVDQLYNDVRRGASAHHVSQDIAYLREDCAR